MGSYAVDGGYSAQSFANDWGILSTIKKISEVTYQELEDLWKAGSPMTAARPVSADSNHAYGIVNVANGLVTVLEPNHISQKRAVRKSAIAWMPEGSTVVEDGIYSGFRNFSEGFPL